MLSQNVYYIWDFENSSEYQKHGNSELYSEVINLQENIVAVHYLTGNVINASTEKTSLCVQVDRYMYIACALFGEDQPTLLALIGQ